MNIHKIEYIAELLFFTLRCFGVLGPLYIWYRAFENSRKIIRILTFVLYFIVQCLWFRYLWFVWLPVTVICIVLLICIELMYGKKLFLHKVGDKYE